MNSWSHWLSLFSAGAHLTIGLPELLKIGPRFVPPSWLLIYSLLPGWEWLYPALFVLTGLVAAIGGWHPVALRLAFRLSSIAFLLWGIAGIYAWHAALGGNIPGSAANLYIAGAAWVLAHYVSIGERSNRIDKQVARLGEQVRQAGESSKADAP